MELKKVELIETPSIKKGYTLPIKKQKIDIMQGYNGPWSHFAFEYYKNIHDYRFAIDFKLPIDSVIYASKSGIIELVTDSQENFYTGFNANEGYKLITNKIIINHEDGTYSLYSHIKKNSAKVSLRERINQGQEIALTGLSGWIGKNPHLHFMVTDKYLTKTFPIKFEDYNGELYHKKIIILH